MAEGHVDVHFNLLEQIFSLPNGARLKTIRLNPRISRTLMLVFDQCGPGGKEILSHDEITEYPIVNLDDDRLPCGCPTNGGCICIRY